MLSEKCFGKNENKCEKNEKKICNFFNIASIDLKITQEAR